MERWLRLKVSSNRWCLHHFPFNYLSLAAASSKVKASVDSYYGPKYISFGIPAVSDVSSLAKDEVLQKEFWELSKKLTKTSFNNL